MERPKTVDIFVLSHSHWDREWYRTFQQFRYELVKHLDHVLDVLKANPTFRHYHLDGQTIPLEDYLEIRPEREEELQRMVQAGRISVGPWYVQPNEFLVSGEAIIRNLLLGHRLARCFGPVLKEGYLPDSFGHISQLPQILKGFRIETFYFMRGLGADCNDVGAEFFWEAPDGSRVLAHHLSQGYSNAAILHHSSQCMLHHENTVWHDSLAELRNKLLHLATTDTILLMNGADHMDIQEDLPEILTGLERETGNRFILGSLTEFIHTVRAKAQKAGHRFKTVRGELYAGRYSFLLQGVISSRIYLKQANHRSLVQLERYSEPLAALAWLFGHEYPHRFLWQAWRLVLQNHPHDSISGCSIDQVHREMVSRFDQADQISALVAEEALARLAEQVMIHSRREDEIPIFIYNPTPWPRSERVTVEVEPYLGYPYGVRTLTSKGYRSVDLSRYVVEDRNGERFPMAIEGESMVVEDYLQGRKIVPKKRLSFTVRGVPGLGYTVVRLVPNDANRPVAGVHRIAASQVCEPSNSIRLENRYFTVEVKCDGTFTVTDRQSGARYFGLNTFEDEADTGDEYNFSPLAGDIPLRLNGTVKDAGRIIWVEKTATWEAVCVRHTGYLPAALTPNRLSRSDKLVPMEMEWVIELQQDVRRIDVTARITNQACDHRLRVVFPAGFPVAEAWMASPFDIVRRKTVPVEGEQWAEGPAGTWPQQEFVAVDAPDGSHGLAVLNKGLPEVQVRPNGDICLTLIRSVGWLSRDDLVTRPGHAGPPYQTPEAQCLGIHEFRYAVVPYQGSWEKAAIWREAQEFTTPLVGVRIRKSAGLLPEEASFLQIEGDAVILSAMKKAEDEEAIIVRVYNPLGQQTRAVLRSLCAVQSAMEVNLNEEDLRPVEVAENGSIILDVAPHKIMTVKLFCSRYRV